jgi:hypothetical protein
MKFVSTIVFLCFINTYLYSQTISGIIRDSNSNKPIGFVTVSMLESKEAISSDYLGRDHMEIKDNKESRVIIEKPSRL